MDLATNMIEREKLLEENRAKKLEIFALEEDLKYINQTFEERRKCETELLCLRQIDVNH